MLYYIILYYHVVNRRQCFDKCSMLWYFVYGLLLLLFFSSLCLMYFKWWLQFWQFNLTSEKRGWDHRCCVGGMSDGGMSRLKVRRVLLVRENFVIQMRGKKKEGLRRIEEDTKGRWGEEWLWMRMKVDKRGRWMKRKQQCVRGEQRKAEEGWSGSRVMKTLWCVVIGPAETAGREERVSVRESEKGGQRKIRINRTRICSFCQITWNI